MPSFRVFTLAYACLLLYSYSAISAAAGIGSIYYYSRLDGGYYLPVVDGKVPQYALHVKVVTDGLPAASWRGSGGEVWEFSVYGPNGVLVRAGSLGAGLTDENGEDLGDPTRYHGVYAYTYPTSLSYSESFFLDNLPSGLDFSFWVECGTPGTYTIYVEGASASIELAPAYRPNLRPTSSSMHPPSTFTEKTIRPSTRGYEVSVTNPCTFSGVVPDVDVQLDYSAVPNSGGHIHHDANRPNGLFESIATNHITEPNGTMPFKINTGSTGKVTIQYTAPQSSGQTKVALSCTLPIPSAYKCDPRDEHVHIGIPGLLRLGNGINYDFIGLTDIHPDTRFGAKNLVDAMRSLADKYVGRYPTTTRKVNGVSVTEPSKLFYNDMSLQYGGLLDCYTSASCKALGGLPWKEPHASHREGKNIDVDTTSIFNAVDGNARLVELRRIIENEFHMKIYDGRGHSTHWHLTTK